MTTQEIAERLVELCRDGKFEDAQKELYADDAVSIEPEAMGGFEKETHGLDGIIQKGHQFNAMIEETHGVEISDPLVSGNSFVMALSMDITMKERGRSTMAELCLYQVKDGKIVSEQFYM